MFYTTDAGDEGVWRVGIARNVACFHSFVASKGSQRGGAEDRLEKLKVSADLMKLSSAKFAPLCGARTIRKPKS